MRNISQVNWTMAGGGQGGSAQAWDCSGITSVCRKINCEKNGRQQLEQQQRSVTNDGFIILFGSRFSSVSVNIFGFSVCVIVNQTKQAIWRHPSWFWDILIGVFLQTCMLNQKYLINAKQMMAEMTASVLGSRTFLFFRETCKRVQK